MFFVVSAENPELLELSDKTVSYVISIQNKGAMECRSRPPISRASDLGGSGFELWYEDQISRTRQTLGQRLRIYHDCFLSHPCQSQKAVYNLHTHRRKNLKPHEKCDVLPALKMTMFWVIPPCRMLRRRTRTASIFRADGGGNILLRNVRVSTYEFTQRHSPLHRRHGNETLGSTKGREFLAQLCDY